MITQTKKKIVYYALEGQSFITEIDSLKSILPFVSLSTSSVVLPGWSRDQYLRSRRLFPFRPRWPVWYLGSANQSWRNRVPDLINNFFPAVSSVNFVAVSEARFFRGLHFSLDKTVYHYSWKLREYAYLRYWRFCREIFLLQISLKGGFLKDWANQISSLIL